MDFGTRTADVTGRALGVAFGVVSRLRGGDKPLHPSGTVAYGTVTRTGVGEPTGVEWIDRSGSDRVFVRASRGGGLPSLLPDVHGLAVRVYLADDRLADLLFSSTGHRAYTRFSVRLTWRLDSGKLGTLMTYRTPNGLRLLGADVSADGDRLVGTLSVATPRGPWQPFATLETEPLRPDDGHGTSFDAFINTVPGLQPSEWVRRLRQRSYAAARNHRDVHVPRTVDEPTAVPDS